MGQAPVRGAEMRHLLIACVFLVLALAPAATQAADQERPAGTAGPDDRDKLAAMSDQAKALRVQGDLAAARSLQEQVVEAYTRVLGPDHSDTLTVMGDLSRTIADQGDYAVARNLQEQLLVVSTRTLGPEHPITLTVMHHLAVSLGGLGERAQPWNFRSRSSRHGLGFSAPTTSIRSAPPTTSPSCLEHRAISRVPETFWSELRRHTPGSSDVTIP
jgi:hypothetical protein